MSLTIPISLSRALSQPLLSCRGPHTQKNRLFYFGLTKRSPPSTLVLDRQLVGTQRWNWRKGKTGGRGGRKGHRDRALTNALTSPLRSHSQPVAVVAPLDRSSAPLLSATIWGFGTRKRATTLLGIGTRETANQKYTKSWPFILRWHSSLTLNLLVSFSVASTDSGATVSPDLNRHTSWLRNVISFSAEPLLLIWMQKYLLFTKTIRIFESVKL